MSIAFPVIPVSDLRYKTKEAMEQVARQPVILTQRGRAAAVIVDFDAYNQLVRRLEVLEEIRDEAVALLAKAHWKEMEFVGLDTLSDLFEDKLGEKLPAASPA